MTEEVEFLFDNQLIAAVENLIRKSKNRLLLISPFIDLDARIMDALNEKKALHNFELQVLFGKNENNYLKSIKKDSLDFLKRFPNVEIRYNERLHAKFYQNDFEHIMTSLNLYDYSLANNIEVGVRCEYASKGLLAKTLNVPFDLLDQGIDKVQQDVLGRDKTVGPLEKFKLIFESSELKYKTRPKVIEKEGIRGLIGGKKLDGFDILVNTLEAVAISKQDLPAAVSTLAVTTAVNVTVSKTISRTVQVKYMSASQLGKTIGVHGREVTAHMQKCGLINEDKITDTGKSKGLVLKNYMGNDYIAYPDDLQELKQISKQ